MRLRADSTKEGAGINPGAFFRSIHASIAPESFLPQIVASPTSTHVEVRSYAKIPSIFLPTTSACGRFVWSLMSVSSGTPRR